jgi:hypothetical protein
MGKPLRSRTSTTEVFRASFQMRLRCVAIRHFAKAHPYREANGDFALNLEFSTARRHRVRAAHTLRPSAQKRRSATTPDLVSTSACRLNNRNFAFAISQNAS